MKKRHTRKRKGIRHWIQMSVIAGLIAGIFTVSALLIWATTIQIPDFSLFENRKVSQSTKIYDRTGTILLYDVHKDVRRTIVPFESISSFSKNATVAIEDEQFYQHGGVQIKAIIRAILVNLHLREGYLGQGGSTITQQVIKNALLSNEKTLTRKLKEWILAVKLEQIMNKEQILALYLNEVPYGGNIYGIEEASMTFFGKHAKDINIVEAAYLAALPQAPTLYSPYGNHTDKLEARKNLVLKKMRDLSMITEETYNETLKTEVKFLPPQLSGIRAPHFVMFIKEQLAEQYGENTLNEVGLRVTTTINMEMQQKAEEIVKQYAAKNAKAFNAQNAALVAIDPKTGQILTMVGSRDYFDETYDGNFNVALAKRQPGSAFKPFVYGAGFEKGYTPDTALFDVPTQFSTRCDAEGNPLPGGTRAMCYMPENYDHQYRGPISVRDALAQSVNVPAVKMLYLVGIDTAIDFAERLGITTLADKARYGLTLVLGGGEVSLLEMTSAYSVFANDGKRNPHTGILKIEDAGGQSLYEYVPNETQVINPEIARKISDVLSDNAARTPAFGADSYLHFANHEVAVKTGTTNDYRDAWIVGYTPSLAVGAWAGNNDNTSMEKKVAGFIVAPLWNAFFTEVFPMMPETRLFEPQPTPQNIKPALRGIWYGGETYAVDKISGKRATEFTPSNLIEERVIPNPHDILYWVNKNDPLGPAPQNPYSDAQFLLWETPAQKWINTHGLPPQALAAIPEGFDDLHRPESIPQVEIVYPSATSTYPRSEKLLIQTHVTNSFPIDRVDFFVNNMFLGSARTMPYDFSFIPEETSGILPVNELRVAVYDTVGNKNEKTISLHVE